MGDILWRKRSQRPSQCLPLWQQPRPENHDIISETEHLGIAQGQLRDYEARLGAAFAHAGYLAAMTDLRNQLEAALSRPAQDGAEASLPPVGALVERLKALHTAHTLDAAPERSAPRRAATVEEAITTRMRQIGRA